METAPNVAKAEQTAANLPNFIFADRASVPLSANKTSTFQGNRGLFRNMQHAFLAITSLNVGDFPSGKDAYFVIRIVEAPKNLQIATVAPSM